MALSFIGSALTLLFPLLLPATALGFTPPAVDRFSAVMAVAGTAPMSVAPHIVSPAGPFIADHASSVALLGGVAALPALAAFYTLGAATLFATDLELRTNAADKLFGSSNDAVLSDAELRARRAAALMAEEDNVWQGVAAKCASMEGCAIDFGLSSSACVEVAHGKWVCV